MRPFIALLLLSLVGCKTTALYGVSVWGQQKYGLLLTNQVCSPAEELVAVSDKLVEEQIDRGERLGLWNGTRLRELVRGKRIGVCLIERPEPCCGAGGCATPYLYEGGAPILAARKGGCAGRNELWVSRVWPPICTPRWPDEPHCATAVSPSYRWQGSTLRHELNHVLMSRAGILPDLLHTDANWARLDAP